MLWPSDTFVDFDHSLNTAVMKLREALGDSTDAPLYIETIPKRGYRFIAPVSQAGETRSGLANSAGISPSPSLNENTLEHESASASVETPPAGRGTGREKRPGATRIQKQRSRTLLFAGAAAAVLLLLTAGFILRRLMGPGAVPTRDVQHLAMERRLTANPPDVPLRNAVISRDGRYVAYADSNGLYLREISSGETRLWSLPTGFVASPDSWFPDGTHLLVLRIGGQPKDFSPGKPSLYKLSILGGEPRELMNNASAGYVSPDGSHIAYLPVPNTNEMWIMDADGANPRQVVSGAEATGIHESWIHPVAWSPTGQHLAYIESHDVAGPNPAGPTHTLRITDPSGAGQTMVLDDPRIGDALWWAPDGRILFAYRGDPASRQDNYGVYSIRVDEHTGKAAGPPQPVTQAEGSIRSMSGTADGKQIVLWRSNITPQVFIASRDGTSHKWKEPRRLTLDANLNIATAWTADSKSVLFVSDRTGTWKIFEQAIDETIPEVLVEGRGISLPRISADGKQVLYLSSSNPDDVSLPVSLMSKPLVGGTPRMVVQGKGIWNHQCANSQLNLCVFSQLDGQNLIFRSFDLEHGAGRELLRMVGSLNWSLSFDGSKLAIFLDPHHIRFVSLDTGAAHDVTVQDWDLNQGDWGASGQTVFAASRSPSGASVILEVDQTGKAKVVLQGGANANLAWMIESPDSRYALLEEFIPTDSNAWMVDAF